MYIKAIGMPSICALKRLFNFFKLRDLFTKTTCLHKKDRMDTNLATLGRFLLPIQLLSKIKS